MLDNKPDQPTKFRKNIWVEINDELRGTYKKVNQIRFKSLMLSSSLCDYRDTYIIVKGTITVAQETAVAPNNLIRR